VFEIVGAVAQKASLSLADVTAKRGDDFSPDLEIQDQITGAWTSYAPGDLIDLGSAGRIRARTKIVNDKSYEGDEFFQLNASNAGGTSYSGTGTLRDDGSGDIFDNNGMVDVFAYRDDDRPVAYSEPVISQALCIDKLFDSQGIPGLIAFLSRGDFTSNRLLNALGS
jgi:hypothetical protein